MRIDCQTMELMKLAFLVAASNVKSLTESGVVNMPVDEEGTQQQQQQKQSQSQGGEFYVCMTESIVLKTIIICYGPLLE